MDLPCKLLSVPTVTGIIELVLVIEKSEIKRDEMKDYFLEEGYLI